jgi:hypothetical protein
VLPAGMACRASGSVLCVLDILAGRYSGVVLWLCITHLQLHLHCGVWCSLTCWAHNGLMMTTGVCLPLGLLYMWVALRCVHMLLLVLLFK